MRVKKLAENKVVKTKRAIKPTEKNVQAAASTVSLKQVKTTSKNDKKPAPKPVVEKVVHKAKTTVTASKATSKPTKQMKGEKLTASEESKTPAQKPASTKPKSSKVSANVKGIISAKDVQPKKGKAGTNNAVGGAAQAELEMKPVSTKSKPVPATKGKNKKESSVPLESSVPVQSTKEQHASIAAAKKSAKTVAQKSPEMETKGKKSSKKTQQDAKPVEQKKSHKKSEANVTSSKTEDDSTPEHDSTDNTTKKAGNKRTKVAKTGEDNATSTEVTSEKPKKRARKGKKDGVDDGDLYFTEYKHAYQDPNWDGNEDDAGSVASGVMEEDFCFECGLSTLSADCWQGVIMCDRCDAEYHLHCLGLTVAPENDFICHRCIKEQQHMDGMNFSVGDRFPIPAVPEGEECRVIYSPSRPLDAAWEECQKKGLMVVSEVFSYELMKKLTHGVIENCTKSGRMVDIWRGATVEVPRRLSSTAFHNVVDREGRYDLKLPEFVVEELKLNEVLEPILSKLRTIMGTPVPQIRTHNVVLVPVGSHSQQWHTDDSMRKHKLHRYFTVLIHLNTLDTGCGGTEVWSDERQLSDLIRCRPGDALVFNGSLLHRGQANLGFSHRLFYYASFACGSDMNVGMM